nr:unnamed protein product [Callosobruchus chinensis]
MCMSAWQKLRNPGYSLNGNIHNTNKGTEIDITIVVCPSGITLNHNMSGRIIHSNQSLVLQKVTRQSAGKYRCSVVNSEGETVSDELDFRVQCQASS